MYYSRETQRKYIRRAIFASFVAILSILFVVISANNIKAQTTTSLYNSQSSNDSYSQVKHNLQSEAEPLYNVISVTDGDTINIDYDGITTPLRLIGIDTPETVDSRVDVECFGPEASDYLKTLLTGKQVRIEADPTQDDRDKYDRLLRYVYLNNEDVGLMLLNGGFASEYTYNDPYQKQAEYKAAEISAKDDNRGQWAPEACNKTAFNTSIQSNTQSQQVVESQPAQCLIKGNISSKGEKIYHVPGQQYYDVTVISPNKGERMFCTEQEAVAAGWRKSKV